MAGKPTDVGILARAKEITATLAAGQEDILLASGPHVFSVSWDLAEGSTRDIDLQGVVVDQKGTIVDAVYYHGPEIFHGGAVRSCRDEGGRSEVTIAASLDSLPEDVEVVLFVVAAYGTGHLRDAKKVRFANREDKEVSPELLCRDVECAGNVDVVGAAYRHSGSSWSFRALRAAIGDGRHFMDVLDELGKAIRLFIPQAPARQIVQFALQRSAIVDLPFAFKKVAVGLGWDATGGEVDLDVSGVLLNDASEEISAVFFGNLEEPGLKHSGDNLTGEGQGDDERIEMTFADIDPACRQILLVINVFTQNRTLDSVQNPYCRLLGNDGEEMARYELAETPGNEPALVIARFFRNPCTLCAEQRWGFQAMGISATGSNYKDSLDDGVRALAKITPQSFQQDRHTRSQARLSCSVESFKQSRSFDPSTLLTGNDADGKNTSICYAEDEEEILTKAEKVFVAAEVQTLPEQQIPASCCVVS